MISVPEDILAKLEKARGESMRPLATEALYRVKLGLMVEDDERPPTVLGKDVVVDHLVSEEAIASAKLDGGTQFSPISKADQLSNKGKKK